MVGLAQALHSDQTFRKLPAFVSVVGLYKYFSMTYILTVYQILFCFQFAVFNDYTYSVYQYNTVCSLIACLPILMAMYSVISWKHLSAYDL